MKANAMVAPVGADFEKARDVAAYLLIEGTPLKRADMVMVFGDPGILGQASFAAYRLYADGYADRIAVSGGSTTPKGVSQARAMEQKLLSMGVPKSRLLVEENSSGVRENVLFTRAAIARRWDNVESVIGVGHVAAGRRFLMTMEKNWPEPVFMAANVNPYPVAPAAWETHPAFNQKARGEMAKIASYLQQGIIAEVDLPAINRRIEQYGKAPTP